MLTILFSYAYQFKDMDKSQAVLYFDQCLIQNYNFLDDLKLKTWDIRVTDNMFIHFKKNYSDKKIEYYSFDIKTFSKLTYVSNTLNTGVINVNSDVDNVIKQTFNDHDGDVDTLLQSLDIPVKDLRQGQIDSLNMALTF